MGHQGGPEKGADSNAAQRDAQGKPPLLNKPSLNRAQREGPDDTGTDRSDGIEQVELRDTLDPAAQYITQPEAERPRKQWEPGAKAVRGPTDEETRYDVDKDMKRLDGRSECVAPTEGLLQGFEENPEGVKRAISGTTNKAGTYNHPAIEESMFPHSCSLISSLMERQSSSVECIS